MGIIMTFSKKISHWIGSKSGARIEKRKIKGPKNLKEQKVYYDRGIMRVDKDIAEQNAKAWIDHINNGFKDPTTKKTAKDKTGS